MKKIKLLVLIAFVISSSELIGQSAEKVEMADILRRDGKIYTVVFGVVIILSAMIALLIRVDRKIFGLEQREKGKGASKKD